MHEEGDAAGAEVGNHEVDISRVRQIRGDDPRGVESGRGVVHAGVESTRGAGDAENEVGEAGVIEGAGVRRGRNSQVGYAIAVDVRDRNRVRGVDRERWAAATTVAATVVVVVVAAGEAEQQHRS